MSANDLPLIDVNKLFPPQHIPFEGCLVKINIPALFRHKTCELEITEERQFENSHAKDAWLFPFHAGRQEIGWVIRLGGSEMWAQALATKW